MVDGVMERLGEMDLPMERGRAASFPGTKRKMITTGKGDEDTENLQRSLTSLFKFLPISELWSLMLVHFQCLLGTQIHMETEV